MQYEQSSGKRKVSLCQCDNGGTICKDLKDVHVNGINLDYRLFAMESEKTFQSMENFIIDYKSDVFTEEYTFQ